MHECNETRCYGWQDNRKMQNMWKTMHARGSWQIEKPLSGYWAGREHIKLPLYIEIYVENLSRSYPEISMDRESVENVSSRQRAQKFGLMDRPSCWDAIEVKFRNLDICWYHILFPLICVPDLKIPKISFSLHRSTRASRTTWRNMFRNRSTRSAFFS